MGYKYYLQKQGIAQGSIMSCLLCSLYYGDLEANHYKGHTSDNGEGEWWYGLCVCSG